MKWTMIISLHCMFCCETGSCPIPRLKDLMNGLFWPCFEWLDYKEILKKSWKCIQCVPNLFESLRKNHIWRWSGPLAPHSFGGETDYRVHSTSNPTLLSLSVGLSDSQQWRCNILSNQSEMHTIHTAPKSCLLNMEDSKLGFICRSAFSLFSMLWQSHIP